MFGLTAQLRLLNTALGVCFLVRRPVERRLQQVWKLELPSSRVFALERLCKMPYRPRPSVRPSAEEACVSATLKGSTPLQHGTILREPRS